MIVEIGTEKQLIDSVDVIRASFKTVADLFGLTRENCPTHPSFITYEKLLELKNKGAHLFGLFIDAVQIGFIAVEKGNEDLFYIEKLAVVPQYRRRGHGRSLMQSAIDHVKKSSGKRISIGIMNKHTVLKNWYKEIGFEEITVKKFVHLPFEVCFLEMHV